MSVPFPLPRLEIGLGLVSLGRVWGVAQTQPPSDARAEALLETACELGIRIFDTAPAYGESETRLGRFLEKLDPSFRAAVTIMTKVGEHWDANGASSFVDHGRDALCRSIDRSLRLLGRIDVLQLHKATRDVVGHPDVAYALDYARTCGITVFGASVSDLESGEAALATGLYRALQFPLNRSNENLLPLVAALRGSGATAIVNRPFAMGGLVTDSTEADAPTQAFRFLAEQVERGIVLTGTADPAHLAQNLEAFRRATGRTA